ncbi:unnamed protein product [Somion occarium]|uniref:Uncharacterized protein n=1 Tax=Somion occarium TaxID=3059160 RepID=A0ABP1EB31_9APHY
MLMELDNKEEDIVMEDGHVVWTLQPLSTSANSPWTIQSDGSWNIGVVAGRKLIKLIIVQRREMGKSEAD